MDSFFASLIMKERRKKRKKGKRFGKKMSKRLDPYLCIFHPAK